MKNDRQNPVSYTHLDVYKRQEMFFALFSTSSSISARRS